MYHHAIRITLPYADCSDIISKWANRSQKAIVYQHDADEEVSKTHVHIGLSGCEVGVEALKRMWPEAPGKGNEFWSYKDWKPETGDRDKYITYMSKGKLSVSFLKNISEQLVETSRLAWVEPTLGNTKTTDHSDKIVSKIVLKFAHITSYNDLEVGVLDDFGNRQSRLQVLLQQVRSCSFKILWGENRKAPHASYYKIIAATAFMTVAERIDCVDLAITALMEKWY